MSLVCKLHDTSNTRGPRSYLYYLATPKINNVLAWLISATSGYITQSENSSAPTSWAVGRKHALGFKRQAGSWSQFRLQFISHSEVITRNVDWNKNYIQISKHEVGWNFFTSSSCAALSHGYNSAAQQRQPNKYQQCIWIMHILSRHQQASLATLGNEQDKQDSLHPPSPKTRHKHLFIKLLLKNT